MIIEDEEKVLEIARLLKAKGGTQGAAAEISRTLGVSGKDIGKVRRMIQQGIIIFNSEGEPQFTIPYDRVVKAIGGRGGKRHMLPEDISRETVIDAYKEQVAKSAKDQTDAMFILANALWQAIVPWFLRRGYTLEDLRTKPIHKTVLEYMEKGEKYDKLLPEYQQLKAENELLKAKTDPIIRLETALNYLIPKTALNLKILDELGADIEPLAKHYSRFITQYLQGGLS